MGLFRGTAVRPLYQRASLKTRVGKVVKPKCFKEAYRLDHDNIHRDVLLLRNHRDVM